MSALPALPNDPSDVSARVIAALQAQLNDMKIKAQAAEDKAQAAEAEVAKARAAEAKARTDKEAAEAKAQAAEAKAKVLKYVWTLQHRCAIQHLRAGF